MRRTIILILNIIIALRAAIGQTLPDVCPGSRARYSVQGLPNSTFSWTVQGGTIINLYNDSVDIQWDTKVGNYQLSVVELTEHNCTGNEVTAIVNVGGDTANIGGDQAVCVGQEATFTTSKPFSSYYWSDSTTQNFFKSNKPGLVWVRVTNSSGCTSSDTALLAINQPTPVNLGPDKILCPDSSLTLDGGIAAVYRWNINVDGQNTPSSAPTLVVTGEKSTQIVSLEIVDQNGCTNSDTIRIDECNLNLIIMNTITPNGDNINDKWIIQGIEWHPKAVIQVFDRWGRLVYQKNGNYQNDWEGRKNGKVLPIDSYYYVIDMKNGSKPITGYLLIIY